MTTFYARGTAARALREATPLARGVSPLTLVPGYYLVRQATRWRVARWLPRAGRWEIGGGFAWPARQWDEIGRKVA